MSVDLNKTSPNQDGSSRHPIHDQLTTSPQDISRDAARLRKSNSISSLDKLTQKIRETQRGLAPVKDEEKRETKKQEINKPSIQKRFIGEVTQEVLIVTEDGCYTSRTDQMTGVIYQHKLNDIREVLSTPASSYQLSLGNLSFIKPG